MVTVYRDGEEYYPNRDVVATILGECHGVRVVRRDVTDHNGMVDEPYRPGDRIEVLAEDDGQWFYKMSFDCVWSRGLIDVLQQSLNVSTTHTEYAEETK